MYGVGPLRERRQLTFVFFNGLCPLRRGGGGGGGGQIPKKIRLQTYLGTKVRIRIFILISKLFYSKRERYIGCIHMPSADMQKKTLLMRLIGVFPVREGQKSPEIVFPLRRGGGGGEGV